MIDIVGAPSSLPPLPGDTQDSQRRTQARKRLRMMTGLWLADLDNHLGEHFHEIPKKAMGKPDISTNLLLNVVQQLAQLYPQIPILYNELAGEQLDDLLEVIKGSGLWAMAPLNQQYVLALREMFVRPVLDGGGLHYRLVTPDLVAAMGSPYNPDIPWWLVEARLREVRRETQWTWDLYDIRNEAEPKYQILLPHDAGDPEDITEELTGSEQSGAEYPYHWTQGIRTGRPLIPHATYHARRTGRLFNTRDWLELIEGALNVACYWTFWGYSVRAASWEQKYSLDAYLRGESEAGDEYSQHGEVITFPDALLQFVTDGDHPAVGTLPKSIDPKTLADAILCYEQRQGVYAGLGPQDFERSEAAESGYAISLKRESVREQQRSYEEEFRRGDIELIEKTAAIVNNLDYDPGTGGKKTGAPWPEESWEIEYRGLPYTTQEIEGRLNALSAQKDLGLVSDVDLYIALHSGISRERALEELKRVRQETRDITAA